MCKSTKTLFDAQRSVLDTFYESSIFRTLMDPDDDSAQSHDCCFCRRVSTGEKQCLAVRVDKIADPKKRHPVHKGVLVLCVVYIRAFWHYM